MLASHFRFLHCIHRYALHFLHCLTLTLSSPPLVLLQVAGTAAAASTNPVVQLTLGDLKYWAPSAAKPAQDYEEYASGDGAGVSNTNFISLLQRNVSTIMAFVSSSTPLQNSTHWNPATDPLTEDMIDFTVPAWFGHIAGIHVL